MGETVVFTSGSWDMFHIGHLKLLKRSRRYGTRLIVGVSTDELIEEYKGCRPTIPYEERFEIIQALACVDKAVKQTVLTDIRQLKRYKVDVVTIGDDWKHKTLAGLEWMKEQGKRVVYLSYTPGVSTTGIKRRIIKSAYDIVYAELRREFESAERWKKEHASQN